MSSAAAKWVIASDHAGFAMKNALRDAMKGLGLPVDDLGVDSETSADYPDYAHAVAKAIHDGRAERGVLVCGSGIGVSIAANRHAGIRAALCHDAFTARVARMHNDANVLCVGARIIGLGVAEDLLRVFVETPFEGGRHQRRVEKIDPNSAA